MRMFWAQSMGKALQVARGEKGDRRGHQALVVATETVQRRRKRSGWAGRWMLFCMLRCCGHPGAEPWYPWAVRYGYAEVAGVRRCREGAEKAESDTDGKPTTSGFHLPRRSVNVWFLLLLRHRLPFPFLTHGPGRRFSAEHRW